MIFEIGFKLAHVLWRKFKPDELKNADKNLIEIGFDTLHEENYPLTIMIFDFATQTLKKYSSTEDYFIMVVNRALAYKWSGNEDKAKEIVTQEDWSAKRGRFRLAEAVLLDDFEKAFEIMLSIGDNDNEIGKEDYRHWPLFKKIKKEKEFLETFEKIYDEPFNKLDESKEIDLPDEIDLETSSISKGREEES